jgi:hypothetical protein
MSNELLKKAREAILHIPYEERTSFIENTLKEIDEALAHQPAPERDPCESKPCSKWPKCGCPSLYECIESEPHFEEQPDGTVIPVDPSEMQPAHELPKLNIRCETRDGLVHGTTRPNVIRVEQEDDGSYTAVTDHWPQEKPAQESET